MMATVYLRVARTGPNRYRYLASVKPSPEPVRTADGMALPTISFGLRLTFPEGAFDPVVTAVDIPADVLHLIPDAQVVE
jgi:hypothetical protein